MANLFKRKDSNVPVMPQLIHCAFVDAIINQDVLGVALFL
jgi:hypothetical protein